MAGLGGAANKHLEEALQLAETRKRFPATQATHNIDAHHSVEWPAYHPSLLPHPSDGTSVTRTPQVGAMHDTLPFISPIIEGRQTPVGDEEEEKISSEHEKVSCWIYMKRFSRYYFQSNGEWRWIPYYVILYLEDGRWIATDRCSIVIYYP